MFLVLLRTLAFQKGWLQPQRVMENPVSFRICWSPMICDLSMDLICPPNKPKSGAKRQKKTQDQFQPFSGQGSVSYEVVTIYIFGLQLRSRRQLHKAY